MELLIPLDLKAKTALYEQIYAYIRREIRNGSLKAEERLPSTRVLAENLKVSRSTTQMAYDQLLAECRRDFQPAYKEEFENQCAMVYRSLPGGILSAALKSWWRAVSRESRRWQPVSRRGLTAGLISPPAGLIWTAFPTTSGES